ncbi:hypothetical protein CHS0354_019321 [Potamilus streckersoni]|uniref:Uncharacterized protein n=1 Tax=Potamilus streckersoni TaxID=2493646 RepID=A0AAE0VWW7_9BIVA|nr:hypothetical protein CHS0354_019321 [Potamilus streckersoni]
MFQKNTIRTNKLADMAKKKRLNRNFLSVVEKAKWVREMEQNNLFGDDDTPASATAHITEVDLKDLGSDINAKILQSLHDPEGQAFSFESSFVGNSPPNKHNAHQPKEDTTDILSKHLLLSGKSNNPASARIFSSDEFQKNTARETRAVDVDAENNFETITSEMDNYATDCDYLEVHKSHKKYEFYLPHDECQDYSVISESGDSSDDRSFTKDTRLPNGHLCNRESVNRVNQNQPYTFAQDMGKIKNRRCSASMSLRKDRLDKQKHHSLYNAQVSREYNENIDISIDDLSKEDLLLMWKASELELSRRLERAIKDKCKLERKLAQLDVHTSTPV